MAYFSIDKSNGQGTQTLTVTPNSTNGTQSTKANTITVKTDTITKTVSVSQTPWYNDCTFYNDGKDFAEYMYLEDAAIDSNQIAGSSARDVLDQEGVYQMEGYTTDATSTDSVFKFRFKTDTSYIKFTSLVEYGAQDPDTDILLVIKASSGALEGISQSGYMYNNGSGWYEFDYGDIESSTARARNITVTLPERFMDYILQHNETYEVELYVCYHYIEGGNVMQTHFYFDPNQSIHKHIEWQLS